MLRVSVTRILREPLLTGRLALLGGIVAVALPTIARAAVNGVVTGCEFTPYLPFVLLAAILLGWWQAALVALASVAILGGLFVGEPGLLNAQACFLSGAGIFLASSAIIIGTILAIRRVLERIQLRIPDESSDGIIFSLERGDVWASWHGHGPPMRLGSKKKVSAMMEDYLAQQKLGERLTGESD